MNGLASSILSLLALVVLFGSRRLACLGLVAGVLYLTQGMALMVAGFNLYPERVLLLVALLRVVIRGEFSGFEVNRLDRTLVLLYAYSVLVFLLRSKEDFVFQIGTAVDALLSYFLFRALIRTLDDVRWLLAAIAILLIPYAVIVWRETLSMDNAFAAIGGYQNALNGDMWFREGRLRATGSFAHPSLMGTIGGSFLPLFIGLMYFERNRRIAAIGLAGCLALVGASNSGGPAVCVITAILGWLLWPMRERMRKVRIGLVVGFFLLALVMNAPIWYVMAKLSSIVGGDGWHRGALLDVAFANLDRWWLAGMSLYGTANWLPYNNTTTGYVDITNTFLLFGLNAGLGAIALLVFLLVVAFSQLGRSMHTIRQHGPAAAQVERLYWGAGVMLTVHVLNWFAITYFDQTNYMWFFHLALIGTLTGNALSRDPARARIVDPQQPRRPDPHPITATARWSARPDRPGTASARHPRG